MAKSLARAALTWVTIFRMRREIGIASICAALLGVKRVPKPHMRMFDGALFLGTGENAAGRNKKFMCDDAQ